MVEVQDDQDPTDPPVGEDSSSESPTDPGEADTPTPSGKSFGEPARLRRPTRAEIADAIESTPTMEDEKRPDIPVPSYLQKDPSDKMRLVGTVAKGQSASSGEVDLPGFTSVPNSDPTLASPESKAPVRKAPERKATGLSDPVLSADEAPEPSSGQRGGGGMMSIVIAAFGLALAAVAFYLLSR